MSNDGGVDTSRRRFLTVATVAVGGAKAARASMARLARPIAECSSAWPRLNRKSSSAPTESQAGAAHGQSCGSIRREAAHNECTATMKA